MWELINNSLIYIYLHACTNIGSVYLRSEDGVVWLRYLLLNLYVYSSPFHLTRLNPFDLSVDREGWWFEHSVSKLRVWLSAEGAKTFPGPSYVSSEDGVVWLWHLLVNLYSFLFHEHSQFTEQQKKGKGISLTPHYHFHPLHRYLHRH